MTFSTSSWIASASAIFCSYSSAVPGVFSRLLQMVLSSFTLANSSYFFCLMAWGIWARVDLRWSMAVFTFSSSFSSSARLISSWDNSRSVPRGEFLKALIDCVSSLTSCLLESLRASKASRLDKFLWIVFAFKAWSSKMGKYDKTLERARDGSPLMVKKTLCIDSVSWTKSAMFFSNMGSISFSRFLVSSDKDSAEEMADDLISSSSKYSSRLKEQL